MFGWAKTVGQIMEKILYACAIMKPSKGVLDIEVKSVVKQFRPPAFAAKIDRCVIPKGDDMLGLALLPVAAEIGLERNL